MDNKIPHVKIIVLSKGTPSMVQKPVILKYSLLITSKQIVFEVTYIKGYSRVSESPAKMYKQTYVTKFYLHFFMIKYTIFSF